MGRKVSVLVILLSCIAVCHSLDEEGADSVERYRMDGIIERPKDSYLTDAEWFSGTRIYTNTGHSAFIKADGSFTLQNLPWGSHFLYVSNPSTAYAPVRIDITNKGKTRLRKINILQPSKVEIISGPLKLIPLGPIRYFQPREQWRITDMLFSPMVLMTVVPLLLLLVLPKLTDTEIGKEYEAAQQQAQSQMPQMETPDLSELFTNLFKGNSLVANDKGERRTGGRGAANTARNVRRRER